MWKILEIKCEKIFLSSINKWLYAHKKLMRTLKKKPSHKKHSSLSFLTHTNILYTLETLFIVLPHTYQQLIHNKILSKKNNLKTSWPYSSKEEVHTRRSILRSEWCLKYFLITIICKNMIGMCMSKIVEKKCVGVLAFFFFLAYSCVKKDLKKIN